jgi:hypothetical protein
MDTREDVAAGRAGTATDQQLASSSNDNDDGTGPDGPCAAAGRTQAQLTFLRDGPRAYHHPNVTACRHHHHTHSQVKGAVKIDPEDAKLQSFPGISLELISQGLTVSINFTVRSWDVCEGDPVLPAAACDSGCT